MKNTNQSFGSAQDKLQRYKVYGIRYRVFLHFLIPLYLIPYTSLTQNIGINATGASPDASAGLDVSFTDKGILIPRIALSATNSASPVTSPAISLLVYNTATAGVSPNNVTPGYYYWDGSAWLRIFSGGGSPGPRWDQIQAPLGNLTLAHAGYITNFTFNSVTTSSAFTISSSSLSSGKLLDLSASSLTTGRVLDVQSSATSGINFALNAQSASNDGYAIRAYKTSTIAATNANFGDRIATIFAQTETPNTIGIFSAANDPSATQSIGVWGFGNGTNSIGIMGIGNGQPFSILSSGSGGYFIGSRFGSYNTNTSSSNGSSWGGSGPYAGSYGSAGTGSTQYHAGVYGYQIGSGINSGGVVGAYSSATWGGLGYTDGSGNVWGMFTPVNSKIQGYLLVGNPSAPATNPAGQYTSLYSHSFDAAAVGWSQWQQCGASTWYYGFGSNNGRLYWIDGAAYNRAYGYSPWIWIPNGVTNVQADFNFICTTEDNWDGVFLEYTTNGSTWTKITAFDIGPYPDNAAGSNTSCSGTDNQSCWNGSVNGPSRTSALGLSNTWIQFRFVAMSDNSTVGTDFSLYGFGVYCTLPSIGGAFAAGNIYAQNNVYAGSNVLLGDVAEYFNVETPTEPGDLIAINSYGKYSISSMAYNPQVIGIHSTNPTVTLNTPLGIPVSLTGRIPVKVSSENGFIRIGDFLASSSLKGHAMKAISSCFVIGRALENFEMKGEGKILCMVEPGWYNPASSVQSSGGSFFIKKEHSSCEINDNSVKEDSRIFITFREKAGSGHWVESVANGKFTLRIDNPSEKDIPFDYFVDNARTDVITPPIAPSSGNVKTPNLGVSKNASQIEIQGEGTPLPEHHSNFPPAPPPQPENGWIWSQETGFRMTKDFAAMKKERENAAAKETEKSENERKEKKAEEKKIMNSREDVYRKSEEK